MPLYDLIEKRLVSCSLDSTVREAARMMGRENVGAILVTEGGMPKGIVTDRDIVLRYLCDGLDGARTAVRDIMTEEVECVSIQDGIQTVTEVMREHEVRRVAIVDEAGKAVGLLSFGDVFALLAKEAIGLAGVVGSRSHAL